MQFGQSTLQNVAIEILHYYLILLFLLHTLNESSSKRSLGRLRCFHACLKLLQFLV